MDARNQNSNGADAADVFPHFLFPFSPFSVPCVDSLPPTGLCRKQKRKKVKVEDWFLSDIINFFTVGIEAVGKRTYCTKNRNTHYKFHIVSIVLMLERLDCIFSRFILSQENL